MQNASETPEGEDMDQLEAHEWNSSEKKELITALQPPSGRGEREKKKGKRKKERKKNRKISILKGFELLTACRNRKHCQKVRTTHKPRKNKM